MGLPTTHKSAKLNHLSTIDKTSSSSLTFQGLNGVNSGGNNRIKGKFKKNEEGFEGLPEESNPMTESDFEEADSCFSCNK